MGGKIQWKLAGGVLGHGLRMETRSAGLVRRKCVGFGIALSAESRKVFVADCHANSTISWANKWLPLVLWALSQVHKCLLYFAHP